ncbi:TetR/AcrR family transcriptional regulator [Novosphingobium cyanobacteriorum]|uniref:TetR family transcriptional regulator n=1 Tax=Novosphingobium cyanobacteriorum TaxID=3024215 RepID=A0ABT6CN02_9SPHN|nr:TetR family transcriptional regulator [Novosphingobium cyanobacteriorum]MDF8335287.1 TetR family transcriptional regulator [Novosphingobium cyanobacteriorum]
MTEAFSPGALAIMRAAERLMGKHGIEGVSMRQITLAAKMANNSAIAYHFGDRNGLLQAISEWRAEPVAAERDRLYRAARDEGTLDSPRSLVRIITRPVLSIRDSDGTHPHAAFVSQMLRSRLGREIRQTLFRPSGLMDELLHRLRSHSLDLPRTLFDFRLRTASLAFYDAVGERDRMAEDDPAWLTSDSEAFLNELEDMVLAVVFRPPGPALES